MTSVTKVYVVKNGTCRVVPGFPIDRHIYGKSNQYHSNRSPQLFELKKKKSNKIKSRYLNFFFVIFLVVIVTHTTEHT